MEIKININNRITKVTYEGKTFEMKTTFLKKFTMNDFIEYTKHIIKERNI